MLQSIYTTIITNIKKSLGKGSGSIVNSVIDHTISISKYNPLAGSSYIKLPKELDHQRYLNPADQNQSESQKLIKILQRDFILKRSNSNQN